MRTDEQKQVVRRWVEAEPDGLFIEPQPEGSGI
jgi:hypothetical protein